MVEARFAHLLPMIRVADEADAMAFPAKAPCRCKKRIQHSRLPQAASRKLNGIGGCSLID
jgi:hypothetical protein